MLCSKEGLLNILLVVTSSYFLECLKDRRKKDKRQINVELQAASSIIVSFFLFLSCMCVAHVGGGCVCDVWVFLGGGIFSISVLTLSVSLVDHLLLSQAKKKNVLELQPLQFFYCCFLISWKYV